MLTSIVLRINCNVETCDRCKHRDMKECRVFCVDLLYRHKGWLRCDSCLNAAKDEEFDIF